MNRVSINRQRRILLLACRKTTSAFSGERISRNQTKLSTSLKTSIVLIGSSMISFPTSNWECPMTLWIWGSNSQIRRITRREIKKMNASTLMSLIPAPKPNNKHMLLSVDLKTIEENKPDANSVLVVLSSLVESNTSWVKFSTKGKDKQRPPKIK